MLQIPALYSQRDPQWSSELLGYNTALPYTIGGYGCLITSLGMLLGQTPHQINETLKANNGFINGGLFVWGKASVLGLTQEYVSYAWTGPVTDSGVIKAKEYIDQGKPLLAEVDFNPATEGEEMHYVLIIGYTDTDDFVCADPWTGTIRSILDAYGGFKRAVCQFRVYDKVLPSGDVQSELDKLQKTLDGVRLERDHNWNLYQTEQTAKIALEDQLANANKIIKDRNTEIVALGQTIKDMGITLDAQSKSIQELKEANTNEQMIIINLKRDIEKMQMDYDILKAQKTQNHAILTGWRAIIHDLLLQ